MLTTDIVYLNGEFMPLADARIPVLDRGFIFGDGVYEVLPVYSRNPFRFDEHLQRAQRRLDGVRLVNPLCAEEWSTPIHQSIASISDEHPAVYLKVLRGLALPAPEFEAQVQPTLFLMSNPMITPPPEQVDTGVACITS